MFVIVIIIKTEREEKLDVVLAAIFQNPRKKIVPMLLQFAGDIPAESIWRVGSQKIGVLQRDREISLSRRYRAIHQRSRYTVVRQPAGA